MTLPDDPSERWRQVRDLLVCPVCRRELADAPDALVCGHCDRAYPVVDGIPWLLPELAREGDRAER